MMRSMCHLLLGSALALTLGSCDGPAADTPACGAAGLTAASRFPAGDPDGHPDPIGAQKARQARAGRVRDASQIVQPANARGKVHLGDYVLANDRVAFYVEGARPSDGYSSLGGELLATELVGPDGRPRGVSQYIETVFLYSRQGVAPDSVTVLHDGSDGKAAVVRVSGALKDIPFFQESFGALLYRSFDLPAALDYVLAPGADHLELRLSLMNVNAEVADFVGHQALGVFQSSRSRLFTESRGYAEPTGANPYLLFDPTASDEGQGAAFALRIPGSSLRYLLSESGFFYFLPAGFTVDGCRTKEQAVAQIFVGEGLDGVRAAIRRLDGDASWRSVSGRVTLSDGAAAAGAVVHALDAQSGAVLTRAPTSAAGTFALQLPPRSTKLTATLAGYAQAPAVALDDKATDAALVLRRHATLRVHVSDASGALPARIQVIPQDAPLATPDDALGVTSEGDGRLYKHFSATGDADLVVPPGKHRVIASHGFEYELFDQTYTVTEGQTVPVSAVLQHTVDSAGVMCADFHIHSYYSADSSDPVEYKVRGALADGLEIPVSSEHEWIIDFQPIIQRLGLTRLAYGLPSEEFTTFTWGHFGIIPIRPRPERVNNGAIQWIGRKPPEVFREIRDLPEKPVLIINHPSGGSAMGSYFTAAKLQRDLGRGDPDMWSDDFGAVEVFNDSDLEYNRGRSVADWFSLLNAGKIVWAVGSSDSHGLRGSPVGYPRTCLKFGHDDPTRLSAEAVRDALRSGAATVSGGLYMTVTGPGGAGPGAMLPPQAGARTFNVVVQAPSWLSAKTLEVIVDGETVDTQALRETVDADPGRRYEATVNVTAKRSQALHWVVFHASAGGADLSPVAPGRKAFAVSNPIFF